MSVNKVILIGNVGKDPDVRYLDTGIAVATFSLATTDRAYTLQNGTQVPERTEWHNIVLWRGLAQTCLLYTSNPRTRIIMSDCIPKNIHLLDKLVVILGGKITKK